MTISNTTGDAVHLRPLNRSGAPPQLKDETLGHKMKYESEHAGRALDIVLRLLPNVTPHAEYWELVDILRAPARWKEAHALFEKIRVNITLPSEQANRNDLDAYFVYVAENAAKTAYNCSGEDLPFDNDSFEWLLVCEQQYIDKLTHS